MLSRPVLHFLREKYLRWFHKNVGIAVISVIYVVFGPELLMCAHSLLFDLYFHLDISWCLELSRSKAGLTEFWYISYTHNNTTHLAFFLHFITSLHMSVLLGIIYQMNYLVQILVLGLLLEAQLRTNWHKPCP